jgi:hypothetical protein
MRGPPRLILEIDVSKLLAVVVVYYVAGVQFLDGPGRREAVKIQLNSLGDRCR